MRLGDPLDAKTTMGPLISEGQLERVLGYLEAGRREARLVFGGGRSADPALARGHYVEPTVFDDVPPTASIAQEEIFGPVLSVIPFRGVDQAIAVANQTIYGLAAAVWTRDLSTAIRLVKAIRAGTIWVNGYHGVGLDHMPYGGFKQSGLGRELGHEGLAEYLETKSVQIKI
jgi:acyl-CoA reductase-like NAD-dependent aldehyde dehydrogenase